MNHAEEPLTKVTGSEMAFDNTFDTRNIDGGCLRIVIVTFK